MFWLLHIVLFLSGVAATANLIGVRFPQFRNFAIQANRFRGLIGFVLLVLALGRFLDLVFNFFFSLTYMLELCLMLALGLIQGIGIVLQLIPGKTGEKILEYNHKLKPYEEILGMIALLVSSISVIKYLFL